MPHLEDYESRRIRILHVEDDAADHELIQSQLRESSLDPELHRVDDEAGTEAAMRHFKPDIVLSDLSMPGFSGYRALQIVREHSRYVPFIFVSGTMGEETAVKALREGATDYIIKNNPARLVPAVDRALREARDRIIRDRAETELLRSQRLDSLAMLAGGLSHDLRNILQPLLMVAPMIAHRTKDERLLRLGELVEDCAKRGLDMVASMLSFARGTGSGVGRVRLQPLLHALDLLLQGTLPRNVRLERHDIAPDLSFEGNDTELQQCLLNLCLNAIQAMPDGGTLSLSASAVDLAATTEIGGTSLPPDRYLRITVADTGTGMSPEAQKRLFTPFYTTKKDGTGLGLLSCKRIIANHRGVIQVVSALGQGTRFELYLPTLSVAGKSLLDGALAVADAHILLVGEEAGSLTLLGDGVALKGYRTHLALSGAAAIRAIEEHGLPDLVVLDADMRLLSSVRTVLQLQERQYVGPVLFLVNEGHTPTQEELPDSLRTACVRKPVDLPELLDAVHRILIDAASQSDALRPTARV